MHLVRIGRVIACPRAGRGRIGSSSLQRYVAPCQRAFSDALSLDDRKAESPYEVIGVLHTASQEELREAYLQLVKELHPDIGTNKEVAESNERFKELQAAWYVIGDPKRRKEFDEHGSLSAPPFKFTDRMWARLRTSKPEEGVVMPNWGTEEPPKWLIVAGPFSVLFLAILFSARWDIYNMVNDHRRMSAGAWPCQKCLVINEADSNVCKACGFTRVVR
mmetsp:Transcript_49306/g.86827  ORF Transcript_49306/g.86827 Transcript_49306/m.86827 type:complete len:219 (+) Transcript_49306:112-768(+)